MAQIRDVMTSDVKTVSPDQTAQEAAGLFVDPDPGPVLANTGLENLRFLTPLYPGDSMRVELTVRSKALKTDDTGIVRWAVEIFNQKDDLVATYDLLTENLP